MLILSGSCSFSLKHYSQIKLANSSFSHQFTQDEKNKKNFQWEPLGTSIENTNW